jgi:hypothetical protein
MAAALQTEHITTGTLRRRRLLLRRYHRNVINFI